jgi:hypothetical protein
MILVHDHPMEKTTDALLCLNPSQFCSYEKKLHMCALIYLLIDNISFNYFIDCLYRCIAIPSELLLVSGLLEGVH